MKELLKKLLDIAEELDKCGEERFADLVEAIIEQLVKDKTKDVVCDDAKEKHHSVEHSEHDEPDKVVEDNEQIKDNLVEVRKVIVDDDNIKDLFDAKEEITKLKNSEEYDLTDDEWELVYKQILEDKFQRDYTKKSKEELEESLKDYQEDKKRKGSLSREEELEYDMINNIYKRQINEAVRPSDKD